MLALQGLLLVCFVNRCVGRDFPLLAGALCLPMAGILGRDPMAAVVLRFALATGMAAGIVHDFQGSHARDPYGREPFGRDPTASPMALLRPLLALVCWRAGFPA